MAQGGRRQRPSPRRHRGHSHSNSKCWNGTNQAARAWLFPHLLQCPSAALCLCGQSSLPCVGASVTTARAFITEAQRAPPQQQQMLEWYESGRACVAVSPFVAVLLCSSVSLRSKQLPCVGASVAARAFTTEAQRAQPQQQQMLEWYESGRACVAVSPFVAVPLCSSVSLRSKQLPYLGDGPGLHHGGAEGTATATANVGMVRIRPRVRGCFPICCRAPLQLCVSAVEAVALPRGISHDGPGLHRRGADLNAQSRTARPSVTRKNYG